jgi:hypothetical protein
MSNDDDDEDYEWLKDDEKEEEFEILPPNRTFGERERDENLPPRYNDENPRPGPEGKWNPRTFHEIWDYIQDGFKPEADVDDEDYYEEPYDEELDEEDEEDEEGEEKAKGQEDEEEEEHKEEEDEDEEEKDEDEDEEDYEEDHEDDTTRHGEDLEEDQEDEEDETDAGEEVDVKGVEDDHKEDEKEDYKEEGDEGRAEVKEAPRLEISEWRTMFVAPEEEIDPSDMDAEIIDDIPGDEDLLDYDPYEQEEDTHEEDYIDAEEAKIRSKLGVDIEDVDLATLEDMYKGVITGDEETEEESVDSHKGEEANRDHKSTDDESPLFDEWEEVKQDKFPVGIYDYDFLDKMDKIHAGIEEETAKNIEARLLKQYEAEKKLSWIMGPITQDDLILQPTPYDPDNYEEPDDVEPEEDVDEMDPLDPPDKPELTISLFSFLLRQAKHFDRMLEKFGMIMPLPSYWVVTGFIAFKSEFWRGYLKGATIIGSILVGGIVWNRFGPPKWAWERPEEEELYIPNQVQSDLRHRIVLLQQAITNLIDRSQDPNRDIAQIVKQCKELIEFNMQAQLKVDALTVISCKNSSYNDLERC